MSDYRWLTEPSQAFLDQDYLLPGQTLDARVDIICDAAESILKKSRFARKLKDYIRRGWFSLSTPIWSNFGTARGLPISCFGSYCEDTMESILYTHAEIGMMSKLGGGTAVYLGEVRPRGADIKDNGKTSGSVHFAQMYDLDVSLVSQGTLRRGNCAAYWPIDHGDILEVLTIRNEGSPIQNLLFGVCISDEWMESMLFGDAQKRKVWAKVLESRQNKGLPYLIFTGNVNRNKPEVYTDKKCDIFHSQLCSEVLLPTNADESFVCDLSSLNLLHWNEWQDTDATETLVYLLDAVMTEFINKASNIKFMERAVKFAERHRAIGVGWIGWHSYLQSRMIPFESMAAKATNTIIAQKLRDQTYAASVKLAAEYGEPELLKGYGRRNTTLMAIAPTKSSSFILGQLSEGIEPFRTNYYIKDLAKGKFTIRNPFLQKLLAEKGEDTEEVWQSIGLQAGSVQHLKFLSDYEKKVFKTFAEISPMEVIIQAAQRQKYIDQGQSLNLLIHPSVPIRDVHTAIVEGWRLGIKSFYYQHSVNAAQEFSRNILSCTSCEG